MSRLVAFAIVVAAALVLAVSASAAGAAPPALDFFQLRLADGSVHVLPWAPKAGMVTDLSPDRSSVLYVDNSQHPVDVTPEGALTLAGIDGSGAHRIVDLPHWIDAATWSPDGSAIAFETVDSTGCAPKPPPCAEFQVWLVGRDGSGLRMLADNAAEPAWSPDSRGLAFVGDYDTHTSTGLVSVENVDGSGLSALTARESAAGPSWSPDGRFIAYTRVLAAGRRDVVRVLDTRRAAQGRTIGRGEAPVWLARSSRLAFVRYLPGNRQGLYVANRSGHRARRLAVEDETKGEIEHVTPSPDGHRIAFGAGESLDVVNTGGRNERKAFPLPAVARAGLSVRMIRWSRNGSSLFFVREGNRGP